MPRASEDVKGDREYTGLAPQLRKGAAFGGDADETLAVAGGDGEAVLAAAAHHRMVQRQEARRFRSGAAGLVHAGVGGNL